MASPVFVNSSTGQTVDLATSLTVAHTPGAGSNRCTLAFVVIRNPDGATRLDTPPTLDGNAMTLVAKKLGPSANAPEVGLWRYVNPPAGPFNVIVTPSASTRISMAVLTYKDVHQTVPFGTGYDASGTSSSPSVTVVGVLTDELALAILGMHDDVTISSVDSGQTRRIQDLVAGTDWAGTNAAKTQDVWEDVTTGDNALAATLSASSDWAMVGAALKAPAASTLTDRSSPVALGGGVISLRTLVGRGLIG